MAKKTRFRAYQLGSAGSSFSYSVDSHFTLIEARLNKMNFSGISHELKLCGRETISCLHITSWDQDHCNPNELELILKLFKPSRIEYPGYSPHTDSGRESLRLIREYNNNDYGVINCVSPQYLEGLEAGKEAQYSNIIYNPTKLSEKSNDNSTVKLFRQGRFTVISLGDCEDASIAECISNCSLAKETDVMILAHHGADNGFTTKEFIQAIKPKIAICSSNYDNQFDHPKQNIRDLLHSEDINLCTTKTGDVVVVCNEDNKIKVYNLISNSTKISSKITVTPKCIVPTDN